MVEARKDWSSFKVEEINDLLDCDHVSYLGEFSVCSCPTRAACGYWSPTVCLMFKLEFDVKAL